MWSIHSAWIVSYKATLEYCRYHQKKVWCHRLQLIPRKITLEVNEADSMASRSRCSNRAVTVTYNIYTKAMQKSWLLLFAIPLGSCWKAESLCAGIRFPFPPACFFTSTTKSSHYYLNLHRMDLQNLQNFQAFKTVFSRFPSQWIVKNDLPPAY